MPEHKGRSGKKPKYQISDIGGTDLTSEDISTERVLNFLIKGDIGAIGESASPVVGTTKEEPTIPSVAHADSGLLSPISEYTNPSEQTAKKSLSDLFERAGGGPSSIRDPSVQSSAIEATSVPFLIDQAPPQATAAEAVSDFGPGGADSSLGITTPQQVANSSNLAASFTTPDATAEPASKGASVHEPFAPAGGDLRLDLPDQIDRWKRLYRLNSGEISALKILFLIADDNAAECYVKMRKLAEMSNLDYRYCQKVVRSLERLGWITKLQDYDASTQLGVLYRVNSRPVHLT